MGTGARPVVGRACQPCLRGTSGRIGARRRTIPIRNGLLAGPGSLLQNVLLAIASGENWRPDARCGLSESELTTKGPGVRLGHRAADQFPTAEAMPQPLCFQPGSDVQMGAGELAPGTGPDPGNEAAALHCGGAPRCGFHHYLYLDGFRTIPASLSRPARPAAS